MKGLREFAEKGEFPRHESRSDRTGQDSTGQAKSTPSAEHMEITYLLGAWLSLQQLPLW